MFQWSSNRRSTATSNYPGQRGASAAIQGSIRPPEHTRAQHLDSYLKDPMLQRSTRRIPPGDSTYDTVFQTVQGDTLILRVSLVDSLPTMTLAGVDATHPWLESGTMRVVGYSPLQNAEQWRNSQLLLGKAVHTVVQEFQVRPPQIRKILDPSLSSIQTKKHPRATVRAAPPVDDAPPDYSAVLQQAPSIDMPTIPTHFDELDGMEREELDRLMEDELEFQAFCNKLSVSRTLQTMATSFVDDNAKVAEENLKNEEELKALREKAVELQQKLKETVSEFTALEAQQDKLCRPPDRRKVTRELTKAKKEAFDQSEQVAEEWLENDAVSVDDFVRDFVQVRKKHHTRAAKLEILELTRR